MRAVKKMPHIRDLALFDSCVTLGRSCLAGVPEYLTADNVLAVMDKHDIAEALVHANEARLVKPRWRGNERLLKQVAGARRLHPVWVLEPPKAPDPVGARKLVEEMLSAGVRVARLMMGHVPPLLWIWSDLCAVLQEHRVLCQLDFVPLGQAGTSSIPDALTIDKLHELANRFPRLPMILSNLCGGLGLSAATMPLLHRCRNVLMDNTSVVDYWRHAARDLGPGRVVFATGMPFFDPATFVGNVQYETSLDEPAKRLICGDNVRRLLEAVQ
jgi:predicted TIM-barrel fold metal-dependent hydrolase